MANWFCDNYSFYGTPGKTYVANMVNGIYASLERGSLNNYLQLLDDPDGSTVSMCLAHLVAGGNNPSSARVAHPAGGQTKMGAALRVWFSVLPPNDGNNAQPMQFLNAGSGVLTGIAVSSTGRLTMYATGGNSYTTTIPVITANGWWHIEFWCDQTNMELRVEGNTVLGPSPHGLTTPSYAQFQSRVAAPVNWGDLIMYLKDTFLCDGTGTHNNNFVGAVILYGKKTTSDVALNWTPSTGSNGYSILANVPPNDSVFISAFNPPPSAYIGGLGPALPADVTSVKSIQTVVRARKSDGGDASLQVGLKSGASVDNGADRPITTSQTYWWDISEEDPATTAPWLPSAADSAQIQINRTT